MNPTIFPELSGVWKEVDLNDEYINHYGKRHTTITISEQNQLLNSLKDKYKCDYTYGGFLENRRDLWYGICKDSDIVTHLGVDFNNLPVNTIVTSPCDAIVYNVYLDESTKDGWGGRVMVNLLDEPNNYLIFGHLNHVGLPREGDILKKGDVIGSIGDSDSNGAWFPHLHVQGMYQKYIDRFDLADLESIDGYDYEHTMDQLKEYVFDPVSLL